MRKLTLVLLGFVLFSCNEVKKESDNSTVKAKPQNSIDSQLVRPKKDSLVTDPILDIRNKVTHINTTRLTQQHIEFLCDETMKIDVFKESGQVVKIIVDYGTIGDVYAREEYYYHDDNLIFLYEFVEGGPACEGCIKKNEYRSYIVGNRVVKYIKDKKATSCRRCEFGPTSKPYRLLKAITKEDFKSILCS